MLTDKQSLILCAILTLGFAIAGIFNILDNLAIIGVLIVCFIILIANIIIVQKRKTDTDSDSSENE